MLIWRLLCGFLFFHIFIAPAWSCTKTGPNGGWKPGVFRGLTMGKSLITDAERVLGQPSWSGQPPESTPGDEVWAEYQGDLGTKITVAFSKKSKRIISIVEDDPPPLSREAAIAKFGPGFCETHYDFDTCLDNGGSAPIYESPSGDVLFLEYRDRGLALLIDSNDKVQSVQYVSKPVGTKKSHCLTPPS